jgi:hypothetical protein
MKKLSVKDYNIYLGFLHMAQDFVGLSGWKVTLDKCYHDLGSSIARVHIDHIEKEADVRVSFEFIEKKDSHKLNILLHELLHTRVAWLNQKCEYYRESEEEEMINDVIRGFELVTKDFSFSGLRTTHKKCKD